MKLKLSRHRRDGSGHASADSDADPSYMQWILTQVGSAGWAAAGASCDDGIAAVIGACRDHWQANIAAAVDGRDPEGVHQVRVGLRRLRSALSLFKSHIPHFA